MNVRKSALAYLVSAVLALGLATGVPVLAQDSPNEQSVTQKADGTVVITLLVYGEDDCPQAKGDDIVVCARRPEAERYRIPPKLRQKADDFSGDRGSWTSHNEALEASTRFTRPNSCSTVGTGGQTGCLAAALHQWYLEKQMDKRREK
jgi:hypothetical protein